MQLTDREIEFLVRFTGHHLSGHNNFAYDLYIKLYNAAIRRGFDEDTLDRPLSFEPISPRVTQPYFFVTPTDPEFLNDKDR